MRFWLKGLSAVILIASLTSCYLATQNEGYTHTRFGAPSAEAARLARGGRLYDKWYGEISVKAPVKSHPSYPLASAYATVPKSNWRCKECHGWDGRGKDGAYKSGKHFTGISGITHVANKPVDSIVALLSDKSHRFDSVLTKRDMQDLALFLSQGQTDMSRFIDKNGEIPTADVSRGAVYYQTLCSQCHGKNGNHSDMKSVLGKVASDNPWEALHKTLHGQPGEEMPALKALDIQISVDILGYLQTLPKNR